MGFTTFTLEDVTAMRDAMKKGVLEVQYQDKKVKFRSFAEMKQTLDWMERELGLQKTTNRVKAEFDKDLC